MQEMQEMWIQSLGQEDPVKEEMATHSSILAWWATVPEVPKSQTQLSMHPLWKTL